MIKVSNINKKYGEKIGNFNISFQVETGSCFGILGPNGAGKSTLIRQIMGFIKSDSGSITFDDNDAYKDHKKIIDEIGYIAGELNLFDELTGNQYLKITKDFKQNVDNEFLDNLIKYYELNTKTKISKMSKGMKQKLAIISAVMNKPKYLILDEPTSGLDPVMQKRFIKMLKKLQNENNTTIIICSHIFEEIMDSADNIIFIKNGEIVNEINRKDLKALEELKIKFESIYIDEVEL